MSWMTHNFGLKVLALFLSASTWAVVVYAENPPQSETLANITVGHGPAPTGLVLLAEPEPVSVTVDGLRGDVAGFRRDSLRAAVDLTEAHRGSNFLPVRVDNSDPTVTVRDVQPAVERVDLDLLGQAARKVQVRLTGQPDACCAAGVPSINGNDTVTLTGPQSQLDTAVVYAQVDISGRQAGIQGQIVSLRFESPDHRALTQITASPSQVSVSVPINPTKVPKTVAIVPDLTGSPEPGWHVAAVVVNPPIVVVQGDPGTLGSLGGVETVAISLDGRTSDFTITGVHLQLPGGVELVSQDAVTVTVSIQPDARPTPPPSSPSPSPSPSPAPSPSH
jgi:YbbR domain-containing protein